MGRYIGDCSNTKFNTCNCNYIIDRKTFVYDSNNLCIKNKHLSQSFYSEDVSIIKRLMNV